MTWITVKEAARRYGCKVANIHNLVNSHGIPTRFGIEIQDITMKRKQRVKYVDAEALAKVKETIK